MLDYSKYTQEELVVLCKTYHSKIEYLQDQLENAGIDFKPTSDDSRWLEFDDHKEKFKHAWRDNIWCKYDNGTIIRYRDKAPAASLTHFIID